VFLVPGCYRGLLAFVLLIQDVPQRHACKSVLVGSVVGVKEFLITVLPRRFQVRICNIPIGPTFSENRTQILAKIFDCGSAKEPIAVVDLVNDETRFKHDRVWDHRIVQRIRVFGNIEIFLNYAPRVGQERPVGANSAAKFIGLNNSVGSDCDQPAICNLELAVELNEALMLPTLLRAVTAATENKNHRIWPLEFRELPALGAVVGKLIIGEDSAWNNIISHLQNFSVCGCVSKRNSLSRNLDMDYVLARSHSVALSTNNNGR